MPPPSSNTNDMHMAQLSITVVIIEDNPAICDLLSHVLRLAGYHYHVVQEKAARLTWLVQPEPFDPPPLLLLDIDCCTQSPVDFIQQIGERVKKFPNIALPIIILTSHLESRGELEREGYPVLIKPFKIRDLLREIKQRAVA